MSTYAANGHVIDVSWQLTYHLIQSHFVRSICVYVMLMCMFVFVYVCVYVRMCAWLQFEKTTFIAPFQIKVWIILHNQDKPYSDTRTINQTI